MNFVTYGAAPRSQSNQGQPGSETVPTEQTASVVLPANYVTVRHASRLTGLTEKAIRRKIEDGKWIEGREYFRSVDGGIFISMKGFEKWVERGRE